MPSVSFTAIAQPNEDGVLLVEVPSATVRTLGTKRRPPVRVSLNGVTYRSMIAVYGGRSYLPVRRELREAAKLEAGKRAKVTLPRDLSSALTKGRAKDAFNAMGSRTNASTSTG